MMQMLYSLMQVKSPLPIGQEPKQSLQHSWESKLLNFTSKTRVQGLYSKTTVRQVPKDKIKSTLQLNGKTVRIS